MENTTPAPATMPLKGKLILGVIAILLVVGVIFVGKFLMSRRMVSVPDTDVKLITAKYVDMKKKLVHGDLNGHIDSKKSFTGRQISFCLITEGHIVMQAETYFLSCAKSDVKQTNVTDGNTFSIRLKPGSWFMNMQLEGTEKSSDLPVRVNIHTGAIATIELHID